MNEKKLILGMSGGVDSTSAALLALEQGYSVTGVTHVVTDTGFEESKKAKSVCRALGIEHRELDLRQVFRHSVIEYFAETYRMGGTPNPCVMCNKTVKLPYLFSEAGQTGLVATGHYARTERSGDSYLLKKGADAKKDQSYMLWAIDRELLSRLVFPLGSMTKEQVREFAREKGLESASRKDSQDICFIPDGDHIAFMKGYLGEAAFSSGNYLDAEGKVLGSHGGHLCYTVGQSRGLGIALGKKMYVVSKNAADNTVVLGDRAQLMKKEVKARGINFLAGDDLSTPVELEVKIRYAAAPAAATVFRSGEDELTAIFREPVSAPAPCQSLVAYDGDTVVAGGEIK